MKRALVLFAALFLCACGATIPADPSKMSADQLREFAKDRNASIACTVVNSPYGRGVMTYVTLDKAVIVDGSLTLDNECKVAITNAPKPAVPPALPPPATEPPAVQLAPAAKPGAKPMRCYPGNKDGSIMVCERGK